MGSVKDSEVLLRYGENNFSSAVGYKSNYGVVSFGFPFETILGEKNRIEIMKSVLNYLGIFLLWFKISRRGLLEMTFISLTRSREKSFLFVV